MNEETEKRCHKFDFVFLALFPQITDLEMRVYGVCVCACVWRPLIDQTREWEKGRAVGWEFVTITWRPIALKRKGERRREREPRASCFDNSRAELTNERTEQTNFETRLTRRDS